MATEPNSADEASKLYNQLMEKENEILSTDKALWEKVFMASNKDTPMIEDGTNYGDFLLKTIEGAKDQFTDEEYKKLVAGAEQIKEIEGKLTILEQKYPECANAPSNGDSVPADSNGVISKGGGATSFPSFDGKDLDGNDIKSSDFFKSNNVTVVNYWFSTCKPYDAIFVTEYTGNVYHTILGEYEFDDNSKNFVKSVESMLSVYADYNI